MTLADFLQSLFAEGKVVATGKTGAFTPDDLLSAEQALRQFYEEDALEMPAIAPDFHAAAALGATQYLYNAVQLIINRDLDAEAVENHLACLPEPASPEIIYSADLTLRYLPELFTLAKGLSPRDIVVVKLRETATRWPFSSVGVEPGDEYTLENIVGHPSLKYAYADRILAKKDKKRAQHPQIKDLVSEMLGAYPAELWPEWESGG
ncbi:MAG: hypothetical protein L6Q97_21875 [Thermoanaerobaculia bacterium]|nr:hypothetical protein [Thermoanaerobaculia bacterium]